MTRILLLSIPGSLGSLALAADGPTIAIVGVHQSSVHLEAQQKAIKELAAAVDRTNRAEALEAMDFGARIAGRQEIVLEEALLQGGRTLLAEGRNLYNQAEPEAAIPVLVQAIEALEGGVALTAELRDLWEAQLVLGTAHVALGDEGAASKAFRDAVAINATRSPDPALYPPDVVALFESVKTESAANLGSLRVTSLEPIEVWLDGDLVGQTPVTIDALRPGTHYIRGRGPGRVATDSVRVAGTSTVLELTPTEPSLGKAAPTPALRSRETASLYRALGRHSQDVDYLLLAGTDETLLHLQLYDPRADTFSKPTSIPYADVATDEAAQTLPLLLNLLDADGGLPSAATDPTAVPLDRGANPQLAALLLEPIAPRVPRGRNRRTALWVGLGAGIVAAGVTGGVYAATRGPRYKGTVSIGAL